MARGRIISPDFWTDGTIIGLTPYARLFYIGMWNFACDKGHLSDDALGLKLKILPADPVEAVDLLAELLGAGRLVRVIIGDKPFLHIPTFPRHQSASADKRWATRCPACKLSQPLESLPESSRTPADSVELKVEGRGAERSGVEGEEPPAFCNKHPQGGVPCGPCKDARIVHEAWLTARRNAPTPTAPRSDPTPMCPKHPGYPNTIISPCAACERESQEAAA